MFRELLPLTLASLMILSACRSGPGKPVESLEGTQDVSSFVLRSLKGTRDGERLDVQAVFGDTSRSFTVQLQVGVTPPPRLVAGSWTGLAAEGEVRERSLTFLGGQSGPPSIGGRFDLIGPDNRPLYRITIPLQQLTDPI